MRQERIRFEADDGRPGDRGAGLHGSSWWPSSRTSHGARRKSASDRASASGSAPRTSRRCWPPPSSARSDWARRAASPRVSDLVALHPSTTGKIELETVGDNVPEERVVERLVTRALLASLRPAPAGRRCLDEVVSASKAASWWRPASWSRRGNTCAGCGRCRVCGAAAATLGTGESPAAIASAVEFVLEGLHLQRRLNKERRAAVGGGGTYRR